MSKIKLLQVLGAKGSGGAESFFCRLTHSLQAQPTIDQQLLVRPNTHRDQLFRDQNFSVTQAPFGSPFFDFKTRQVFRRTIETFQPDIVLTWMNRASVFCPAGRQKKFIHVARLGGYYDLKYYKNCDYLIGNTPMIVDYLVDQGWPKDKTIYIPNFAPEVKTKALKRTELRVPKDMPLILGVGRLHENKAFDVLIDAFANTATGHLMLAGTGPLEQTLKKQVQDLNLQDRVTFLGWREDIPALLATCDIFVCPSRHEPLGNVVLEAWAAKKPVIVAQSHGPDMLVNQEKTGLKFPIDDVRTLTKHLTRLINSPEERKTLAKAGYAAFKKAYTEDIITAQYLDFFKSIV